MKMLTYDRFHCKLFFLQFISLLFPSLSSPLYLPLYPFSSRGTRAMTLSACQQ